MDERLKEAAREGNVNLLHQLLHQDASLLDRLLITCSHSETPLHIASMHGKYQFVQAILVLKPDLAKELDSRRASPLHLAAAKGYVEIMRSLVQANPDMCFVCDEDGRNPVHIAALKGHLDVLRVLVQVRPEAGRVLLERNETILHACLRDKQIEAMKVLLGTVSNRGFVNTKNYDGNTVLHLAVANQQIEAVRYLVMNATIEINSTNMDGLAALDLLSQNKRDLKDQEIYDFLRGIGATSAMAIPLSNHELKLTRKQILAPPENTRASKKEMEKHKKKLQSMNDQQWLERKKNSLMVVASLLATMGFAGCLTPPGGLWQDGDSVGLAILANQKAQGSFPVHLPGHLYGWFLSLNTTGLVASLSIILLLVSGLPMRHKFFLWVLMVILWMAITAMALTYLVAIIAYTPKSESEQLVRVLVLTVLFWVGLMLLLFIVHTLRLIYRMLKFLVKGPKKKIQ